MVGRRWSWREVGNEGRGGRGPNSLDECGIDLLSISLDSSCTKLILWRSVDQL